MRVLTVGENDAGRRLDRFLGACFPHLPPALLQRWIREKRVRLRGRHVAASARVEAGDEVKLFVADDALASPGADMSPALPKRVALEVVYEDTHVLIVHKPAGQSVHPDRFGDCDTLLGHVQGYCLAHGDWKPDEENSFAPALCHRLDKNTEGLVIAAKTAPALRLLNECMAARTIRKFYLCLVHGVLAQEQGELTHFLRRDFDAKQVTVFDKPVPDGRKAVLRYRVLSARDGRSLLEVELLIGRTHQIRAQLAYIGHPLVGDGKYGRPEKGFRGQALCANRLVFGEMGGVLAGLSGREVVSERPEWGK